MADFGANRSRGQLRSIHLLRQGHPNATPGINSNAMGVVDVASHRPRFDFISSDLLWLPLRRNLRPLRAHISHLIETLATIRPELKTTTFGLALSELDIPPSAQSSFLRYSVSGFFGFKLKTLPLKLQEPLVLCLWHSTLKPDLSTNIRLQVEM